MNTKEKLLAHCKKFIEEHKISGGENVYQDDDVILNAYEFIEGICEIVGYYEYPEDEL